MINVAQNFGRPYGYYIGNTPVMPATAVNPAAAGQTYGGQGMGMPAGATAPSGMNWGSGAASLISGLSDAAQQYVAADALKAQIPFQLSTKLASFQEPVLNPRPSVQA